MKLFSWYIFRIELGIEKFLELKKGKLTYQCESAHPQVLDASQKQSKSKFRHPILDGTEAETAPTFTNQMERYTWDGCHVLM